MGSAPLTAFPVTGPHAPAIALADPLMSDPMMPGTRRCPMALDPFMPAADPIPVSTDPHISRRWGYADDLHARRGRRHHHQAVGIIMALVGNDHAPRQGHDKSQTGCETHAQPFALVHDGDHVL